MLARTGFRLGIHCQNDTGCAVANTIAAVEAGVTHVQCTANGYGERPGNADLFAVIGNLSTKMGIPVLPDGGMADMVRVSHALADLANIAPDSHQPYVGSVAFAHKAGLHASAIKVGPEMYNHIDPGHRRKRHANPDHRDGRPGVGRTEGGRVGHRPDRQPRGRLAGGGDGEAPGGRGLVLRGRRRVVPVAAP